MYEEFLAVCEKEHAIDTVEYKQCKDEVIDNMFDFIKALENNKE